MTSSEQFKPNTTVAMIVHCQGEYLVVEEIDFEQALLNQPAGHVEPGESLINAAIRETYEETGITVTPEYVSGIYYFYSDKLDTHFLRFCFVCELNSKPKNAQPQDSDIINTYWLTKEQLYAQSKRMRSPLVLQCFDDYFNKQKIELNCIKSNL